MSADAFFQQLWYRKTPSWIAILLQPLSWLFRAVVAARRGMYSAGIARQYKLSKPIVVVGNITVGGTGKTPFTIWLANRLQQSGVRVGIVLRGYGAKPHALPYVVQRDASWHLAGDEALVIAHSTEAIVVIDPDRVRAAQQAIELGVQIVLSDDGLQHLRLGRDFEIAVVDSARGIGNGRLLPAGPLREPASRLETVNRRVRMHRSNGVSGVCGSRTFAADIDARAVLGDAHSLVSAAKRALSDFSGQRIHAVAGIGNPHAFFTMLRSAGLHIVEHPFPDHAVLRREDVMFADDAPVLMTQKDAVRCRGFATEQMWAVEMELEVDSLAANALLDELKALLDAQNSSLVM
jgi:tetraacyldisaccharide 4'-kinase